MDLTYYSISALINFSVSFLLGIFVIYKNFHSRLNRALFFWCLTVASWSFFYFLWQIESQEPKALLWTRLLMLGAIWVPIAYFRVVAIFLNIEKEQKKFIYFIYILSSIFTVLLLTPLMVKEVDPIAGFQFWPQPGIAYAPFLVMFLGVSAYAIYLSVKALRREKSPVKRAQIIYMLLGIAISIIGGSTNYFLWYGIPIKPYGNIFASTYVIFTVYAIFKHHLLNIKVIVTELLTGLIILVILFEVFISKNTFEFVLRSIFLILVTVFGYLLVRSVNKEIKQREQIQRIAKKLKSANTELKKLDEAKSNFVSIASHQLRTPITGIKGYLSMFLEGDFGDLDEKQQKILKDNLDAVERMVKLIDIFLDISRIEAGRVQLTKEPIQMEDVIDSVMKELSQLTKDKGLKLKKDIKGKLPKVMIDREKIRQVIMNLIDNSLKYTIKGEITVKAWAKNKKLFVEVSDTGIGIAKDEVPRLFVKFVRAGAGAKINQDGSGLGLFIIKGMVEAHGGEVFVSSQGKGKGSTFGFSLPLTGAK